MYACAFEREKREKREKTASHISIYANRFEYVEVNRFLYRSRTFVSYVCMSCIDAVSCFYLCRLHEYQTHTCSTM